MKRTLAALSLVVSACARRDLSERELAQARIDGHIIISTAECGATLRPREGACDIEGDTTSSGFKFRITCPELRGVCGVDYDCTCRPRVRSALRNGPRPQATEPLSDPFHSTRLVGDEPVKSHNTEDCWAALYAGPRDCFVSGKREPERARLIDGKRVWVTDMGTPAPFEYWLACGEETNLCGKPATCTCGSE